MNKQLILLLVLVLPLAGRSADFIANGLQWHDEQGRPVSAHGANIIYDQGRYWLFGEYKTDSANVFTGFSCYSSTDLCNWHFERIVLSAQKDGRLGPNRVGERPKVLHCPTTGEYVMLLHSDNLRYKDPCVAYATSPTINGEYTFRGPLLYKGQIIKRWDIGSFVDNDGQAYLLIHHGRIYRLAPDFHSVDSCIVTDVKGVGESPAMLHEDDTYYWLSSHTTSWERNDNIYFTAKSLSGPWTAQGCFAPEGTVTWNSQCSFVLPLQSESGEKRFMYMGDRWSFPRQRSAATYVWLPLLVQNGRLSLPEYHQFWNPATGNPVHLSLRQIHKSWTGEKPGDDCVVKFKGGQIAINGKTNDHGAYAEITITDKKGHKVVDTSVDFYSAVSSRDVRYLSPVLPHGKYTLSIRVSQMKPNWSDKYRSDYGSKGYEVNIDSICQVLP